MSDPPHMNSSPAVNTYWSREALPASSAYQAARQHTRLQGSSLVPMPPRKRPRREAAGKPCAAASPSPEAPPCDTTERQGSGATSTSTGIPEEAELLRAAVLDILAARKPGASC
eukprot:jgi/Tetstr1/425196/TSEL_015657.t1